MDFSVALSEAKGLNHLKIRDSSVDSLPPNDTQKDFCQRLKSIFLLSPLPPTGGED